MLYNFKINKYVEIFNKLNELDEKGRELQRSLSHNEIELNLVIDELKAIKKEIESTSIINRLFSKKDKKLLLKETELTIRKEKLEKLIKDLYIKLDNIDTAIKVIGDMPDYIKKYVEIRRDLIEKAEYKDGILFINGNTDLDPNAINIPFDSDFSIDDIVLVHATNTMPQDGIIKAATEKTLEEMGIRYSQHRLTTHFALNGRVGNHTTNIWDDRGIIIIDPLNEHINQVINFLTVDTYFSGNFHISDKAIIMVREDLISSLSKKCLSQYKIVTFSGSNITAVNKLLVMLGYKPQTVGKDIWENEENQKLVTDYFKINYPNIRSSIHYGSVESKIEIALQGRDKRYAEALGLNEINSSDGIKNISLEVLQKIYINYILFAESKKPPELNLNMIMDWNHFFTFVHENYIAYTDNKINFLGTKESLEYEHKYQENPNLYEEMYQLLYQKLIGIRKLSLDEVNNDFEYALSINVETDPSDEIKKRNFYYYINDLKGDILVFNNIIYKVEDNFINKKIKPQISREITDQIYDEMIRTVEHDAPTHHK